jgi:hypothetical protein
LTTERFLDAHRAEIAGATTYHTIDTKRAMV